VQNRKRAASEAPKTEDSAARAKRQAEQLRFKMREAMAQRGNPEAFLNWLRTNGRKSE
jgi:hypothetical protein